MKGNVEYKKFIFKRMSELTIKNATGGFLIVHIVL